ncbi:exodeoxyribonuclease VII small subunit [Candidatus Sneabacter namystus]|uniref:Exodeoxyribonuclease 7 small subunit n=1 Tax=Candidatus Sneabacter namystus TaxID=2601646 RepID=A0A5C0UJ12_9RICK|nr:exodeoxyribonuclease VII small subunit [Candidatus Sneabacter namystus]QEK39601.1 exodeoxyribonuclease VII small subunit [Candidatus Sneabacter namystus]
MVQNNDSNDISQLSFEDSMKALEKIVAKIDSGEGSLEEMVSSFEIAVKLHRHCTMKLEQARMKIEKVVNVQDKKVEVESMSCDDG